MVERLDLDLKSGITLGELRKFFENLDDSTRIFWCEDNEEDCLDYGIKSMYFEKTYWRDEKIYQIDINVNISKFE